MSRTVILASVILILPLFATAFAQDSSGEHTSSTVLDAAVISQQAGPTTPDEVAKGRTLAIAGNCITCHTAADGQPFAGGVAFPTPFGTIYSTNISQDQQTGIGNWSLGDFKKAIREGVRPDGVHLYPAFPYTSFTKLTDDDIAALYVYMRTIAPVNAPVQANALNFPFSQRSLMAIWNAMFLKEGAYKPDPSQSTDWNRGAYLVQGVGHCGACHSPRNFLGAERSDADLAGGVFTDKVKGGEYRKWAAVNLTPAKVGLAAWTTDDLVAYLKTGISIRATTFGPMNEVVMNSTSHLSEDDIHAIATYLKGTSEKIPNSGRQPSSQTIAAGETIYTIRCGSCHLPTGMGAPDLGVSLVGSAVVQAADPSSLINTILYGLQLPPPPFVSGRRVMTSFVNEMSDDEIAQVASYVRASWGNSAGEVSAAQVAIQR